MVTLEDIKGEVERLAAKINAPSNLLPDFGQQKWDAQPYIEVDKGEIYYVISEHGQELDRKISYKLDDILYWTFSDITFAMATDFERKHRIENQDFRRIIFEKQQELLGLLNENWKEKERHEQQAILEIRPFKDNTN